MRTDWSGALRSTSAISSECCSLYRADKPYSCSWKRPVFSRCNPSLCSRIITARFCQNWSPLNVPVCSNTISARIMGACCSHTKFIIFLHTYCALCCLLRCLLSFGVKAGKSLHRRTIHLLLSIQGCGDEQRMIRLTWVFLQSSLCLGASVLVVLFSVFLLAILFKWPLSSLFNFSSICWALL